MLRGGFCMSELLLEATGMRVDYALRRVLDIDRF